MSVATINNSEIFVETSYTDFNNDVNSCKTHADQNNSVVFIKDKEMIYARGSYYGIGSDKVGDLTTAISNNTTNISTIQGALKWKNTQQEGGSSGSGSGSGNSGNSTIINNYVMSNISVINHTSSESTATIVSGVYHVWPEMSSLSITLEPRSDNYLAQYMFEFISGSTPTNLSLPSSVKIAEPSTIFPNKKCQVSIVNNIGVILCVDNA